MSKRPRRTWRRELSKPILRIELAVIPRRYSWLPRISQPRIRFRRLFLFSPSPLPSGYEMGSSRSDLMWRTTTRHHQAHRRDCRDRGSIVAEPLSAGGRRDETRRLKRAEVQRELESQCPDTDSFAKLRLLKTLRHFLDSQKLEKWEKMVNNFLTEQRKANITEFALIYLLIL